GDVNRDGKDDLAVTNRVDNTVSVLLGDRTDGFLPQQTFAVDNGPSAVTLGDFDGDGKLDLAVTNGAGGAVQTSAETVSSLPGNGGGTFQAQQRFITGVAPSSVAAADVNADGRLDLVVANFADHTVSVLLGKGDDTFVAPTAVVAGLLPNSVAAAD